MQHSAAPPGVRLSLRWKAFLVVVLLLGTAHGVLAFLGARNLERVIRQQADRDMGRSSAAFVALLEQTSDSNARLARLLAASVDAARLEDGVEPEALRNSDLLLELQGVELHGKSALLAAWSLGMDGEAPARRSAVEKAFSRGAPLWSLECATVCVQHTFVPALDRRGSEIVVVIVRAVSGILQDFHAQSATDAAILLPGAETGGAAAAAWRVQAVTRAATIRPMLDELQRSGSLVIPEGRSLWRSVGNAHYYLRALPALSQSEGPPVTVLLIRDITESIGRIAVERRAFLTSAGVGLLVSALAVFLLLTPAMRRLQRMTHALPLLAERRYDAARDLIRTGSSGSAMADEIDILKRVSLELADRLEQLHGIEAESAEKSRFLAAMSHEIRTPMNGILGLLELHEATSLSEDQRSTVRTIRDSALTLLTVIDDVLDYSKIEAGGVELESVTFSLLDLVEGVVRTLATTADASRLRLISFVDPALPPQLLGDPVRIRQVLFNLCGNAIKFTKEGRVIVRVEADEDGATARGTVRVRFSVEDTGIGIPADRHDRLFRPFSQADASTTRRFGGTGLGLVISKGLVERMGGTISFTSAEGQGSTFRISIPLRVPDTAPLAAPPQPLREVAVELRLRDEKEAALLARYLESAGARRAGADAVSRIVIRDDATSGHLVAAREPAESRFVSTLKRPVGYTALVRVVAGLCGRDTGKTERVRLAKPAAAAGATVLVAEDHPTNRLVIAEQLRRLGCVVEFASDGKEALERLARSTFALLLTDIHMPEMDGVQLTEEIRRRELADGGRRLPVIALTADVLPESMRRFRAAGMDDVLTKPVSLAAMKEVLGRWLPSLPAAPAPVLDPSVLSRLIGDDPDMRREVLEDFVRVNRETLRRLDEAVRLAETENVRLLAHRLKGSARTVGGENLAEKAAVLEVAGRNGEDYRFAALLKPVQSEFERVRQFIANESVDSGA